MTGRLVLPIALPALLFTPSPAFADKRAEAEAFNTLARSAFQEGRFEDCAEYFAKSHALVADPNNLFNQGLCSEKAEKYPEALAALTEYLRLAPSGSKAGEARTRIELLEYKIANPKNVIPVREEEPPAPSGPPAPAQDDPTPPQVAAERESSAESSAISSEEPLKMQEPKSLLGGQRVAAAPLAGRVGLGVSYLSDGEDAYPSPRLAVRMQLKTSSGPKPILAGIGVDVGYSPLLGVTSGIALGFSAPILIFRAYGEMSIGLQIRDGSGFFPDLGYDLPLRVGLEIPISRWTIGFEYGTRPLDDVDGFGLQLAYMLGP